MLGAFGTPARSAPPRRPDETAARAAGVASAAAARAADTAAAAVAAVEQAAERVEEVIDQETAALRVGTAVDLRDFNDRKSQGLLELTRAMRHVEGQAPGPALTARLVRLRGKLEVNQAALKMHLDAVREISTIVADAMRAAD